MNTRYARYEGGRSTMVQEVRRIMLTRDELVSAFESYRRQNPDFLPEGRVVNCTPLDESTVQATVGSTESGAWQVRHVVVKGVNVLKPLIRFCIENQIMLPKEGRKSIAILNGSIVICIALDVAIDVSAYIQPPRAPAFTPADILKDKFPEAINSKA